MKRLRIVTAAATTILALACTPSNEEAKPAATGEGMRHSNIQIGADKDDVLAEYGAPEGFVVQEGSLLTRISIDRAGKRRLGRPQPGDEAWFWMYEHFFLVIADGKVLRIGQAARPETNNSPSPPHTDSGDPAPQAHR